MSDLTAEQRKALKAMIKVELKRGESYGDLILGAGALRASGEGWINPPANPFSYGKA